MPDFANLNSRLKWRVQCALGGALVGSVIFLGGAAERRTLAGRWWEGERMKLELLVPGCWWWAGLAIAALLLGLLMTSPWWLKPWPAVFPKAVPPAPRWLILAVLGVMAVGAAVRIPRLGLSLYNDEAHAFRAHLAGEVPKVWLGNPAKFRALPWWSTLYENRAGNNSPLFSLATRTSYDLWRAISGAPVGQVNETALRLPVLICGVLSIWAMAWLALKLGGPGMALMVAVLTAFHPWHMRYSVEARNYGMLMLALPLLFLSLEVALRTGRWRHWLGFGAVMGLTVSLWLGTAYLMIALYATLSVIAFCRPLRGRRATLLAPAAVAGICGLGLYLMINLPLHWQLAKALQDPLFFKTPNPFPVAWFQDVAGFLGFGIPGHSVDGSLSGQPNVMQLLRGPWAWATAVAIAVWVIGLVAGLWRLCRESGAGLLLAGAFCGGALLIWIYCSVKGIVFLKWYAIFLLPALLLILASGWNHLLKSRAPAWQAVVLLPLLAAWWPGLICYTRQGRENLRGVVEQARGTLYPASLCNPAKTLYGITWSESAVYDPSAIPLKDGTALVALVARARQDNRLLFVAHGHLPQARQNAGDILAILQDSSRFGPAAIFPGLDEGSSTHYLYQLLPTQQSEAP